MVKRFGCDFFWHWVGGVPWGEVPGKIVGVTTTVRCRDRFFPNLPGIR